MIAPAVVEHRHTPLYRVIRRSWPDPLDSAFSRQRPDNRWNTGDYPALYCCCSQPVARAVTLDLFRVAGVELSDLRASVRPQLIEIAWEGRVADMISPQGIASAGFPERYPDGVDKAATRQAAAGWHAAGLEGVVCRSASLGRRGFRNWQGTHERWSEVAVFVRNSPVAPALMRRRDDLEWLAAGRPGE